MDQPVNWYCLHVVYRRTLLSITTDLAKVYHTCDIIVYIVCLFVYLFVCLFIYLFTYFIYLFI